MFLALHDLSTGYHLLGVSIYNKPEVELMPSCNHTLLLKITVLNTQNMTAPQSRVFLTRIH